jgi:hypothetical protein
MLRFHETGAIDVLSASGVARYSRHEAAELLVLIDQAREHGGSPRLVMDWLTASAMPRALDHVLRDELRARGYELECPLCLAGVDGRRLSLARVRRLYNITASRQVLRDHRAHARRRRRHPPARVDRCAPPPALNGDPASAPTK